MAKKSKFIVDEERKAYLERLADLSRKVNPKKPKAEIERLKKMYLEMRNLPY